MNYILRPYEEVRPEIRDGTLLAFRDMPGLYARLIRRHERHTVSHVELARWWGAHLMSVGMLHPYGRAARLRPMVVEMPGHIDVYQYAGDPRVAELAAENMCGYIGVRYGWPGIWDIAMGRYSTDDARKGGLPFCSDAVSRAYSLAGDDPVKDLADTSTEPVDLIRCGRFHYSCTLVVPAKD